MKYISVCSGIEAASVAWKPLGWEPVAFAEIDTFPSAVLTHHYPDVPWKGAAHAPDTLRWKAIGNSMCVNVMRWIGERIQRVGDV